MALFSFTNRAVAAMAVRPCAFPWRNLKSVDLMFWKHTHLIIDVVPGRGGGFSLESPEGIRFLTRSRVFSDEELQTLEAQEAKNTVTP